MTRERRGGVPEEPPEMLCDEAQADGVPCWEVGRDCEVCERARPRPDPRDRPSAQADGER